MHNSQRGNISFPGKSFPHVETLFQVVNLFTYSNYVIYDVKFQPVTRFTDMKACLFAVSPFPPRPLFSGIIKVFLPRLSFHGSKKSSERCICPISELSNAISVEKFIKLQGY